jgi:valyl-tRNA synthetase
MSSPTAADLPKQYDHLAAQQRWYAFWDSQGYFRSDPEPGRPHYTIVIPPPNVTGALHLGHALNNSLQDILIRWRRMQGYNTLWMPGTDHAGIATQAVVERRLLQEENKTRHDLGRDALVARIWQWKEEYEARILGQLRQMGCSCDWRRTRFTLDPICARAVRQTFFRLFQAGLIYRGNRLVNWDTHLQTAVADDEIFHEPIKGSFWTFKYPIQDAPGEFIRFSTTRPETMLGDTAVAVHPADARYKHLIGKRAIIPLVGREIPIIADDQLVNPELGTGAVKVTPAHDPNDYACGLRHGLPMINILNPDGTINAHGGKYQALDRFEARQRVTAEMEALGLLESVEDREIDLAHSDRSRTPIEPLLSLQWFVRMSDTPQGPGLAQQAMDAVASGRVRIFPERYARTYLDWLGEKRDWCISRQLWWGHRIPVWHAPPHEERQLRGAFAGRDDIAIARDAATGGWLIGSLTEDLPEDAVPGCSIVQDPDVLDTWFSSALWPHSTFGWPEMTPELRYYYPTSTLVTSRDIITLWVARMVLTGLFNLGEVPFREVYIHPKILDRYGEGMSKSKGNGVDPIDVIERFGADALRFGLAYLATETQDARMPVDFVCPHCQTAFPQTKENRLLPRINCPKCGQPLATQWAERPEDKALPRGVVTSERFELGRNFCNKLWNAARFAMLNLEGYTPGVVRPEELALEDRWILSRLATVTRSVSGSLERYEFADAARLLYTFAWDEFCSFYIEMLKNRLAQGAARPVAQRALAHTLDVVIRLLHPFIPFLAEEVWQHLGTFAAQRGLPEPAEAAASVMIAPWPPAADEHINARSESSFGRFQEVLRGLRDIRARQSIAPRQQLEFVVRCSEAVAEELRPLAGYFPPMAAARARALGPQVAAPSPGASFKAAEVEVVVDLAGLIDVAAELARNQAERQKLQGLILAKEKKLANESFVLRAPAEVVQKERESLRELKERLEGVETVLGELARQG